MLSRVWDRIVGYDRLKARGDQLFLAGELARAREEYERTRNILREDDHRAPTLDALIRECTRVGAEATVNALYEEEDGAFPGSRDLFELAIAEKNDERIEEYRRLGKNFESGYLALVRGDAAKAIQFLEKSRASGSPSFIELMELGRALSLGERMEEARSVLKEPNGSLPPTVKFSFCWLPSTWSWAGSRRLMTFSSSS